MRSDEHLDVGKACRSGLDVRIGTSAVHIAFDAADSGALLIAHKSLLYYSLHSSQRNMGQKST